MNNIAEFLQEQYKKIKEFYHIQSQSYPEYAELFPVDNFPEMKQYTDDKLKQAFNVLLNLYGYEFTIPEVKHLLQIDNSYLNCILVDTIKFSKTEVAKVILDNTKTADLNLVRSISDGIEEAKQCYRQIDSSVIETVIHKMEKIDTTDLSAITKLIGSDQVSLKAMKLIFEKIKDPSLCILLVFKLYYTVKDIDLFKVIHGIADAVESANEISYRDLSILSELPNTSGYIDLACSKFKWRTEEQLGTKKALDVAIKQEEELDFIDLLVTQLKQVSLDVILTAVCYKNFEILPKLFENLKPKAYEECLKLVEEYDVPPHIKEKIEDIITSARLDESISDSVTVTGDFTPIAE